MDYRVYLLDSKGSILSGETFGAESEAEARDYALRRAEKRPVELWQGTRLIEAFGQQRATG